jgi:O-antigen ligase
MIVLICFGFGVLIVLGLFVKTQWALYALLAYLPFLDMAGEIKTGIPALNLTTVIIYLAFTVSLFKKDIRLPAMAYPLIGYILLAYLSSVYVSLSQFGTRGLDPIVQAKRSIDTMFLYLVFVFAIHEEDEIEKCLLFMIVGFSLESAWAFKDHLLGSKRRLVGTLKANELGAFISSYLFIPVFYLLEVLKSPKEKGWSRVCITLFSIPISVLSLLFSLSRGAMISAAAALPVFGFFRSKMVFAVSIGLVGSVVLFYNVLLPDNVVARLESTFQDRGDDMELDQSAGARVVFLDYALELFAENPIVGVGYANSGRYYEEKFGQARATHNEWARILCETGLIGFLLYASIFALALGSGVRLWRHAECSFDKGFAAAYIASIASIVIVNMTGNRFANGIVAAYFWVLSALIHRRYLLIGRGAEVGTRGDGHKACTNANQNPLSHRVL